LSHEMVKSLIAVAHKSGYDEVKLQFDDPRVVQTVQDRIREMLMGYELITHTATSCTIRSIASDEAQEFNQVFRRAFLVTIEMAQRTVALVEGKSELRSELLSLEHSNNRLTNFCHRLLNRGVIRIERAHYAYVISWVFESIADVFKRLIFFNEQHPEYQLKGPLSVSAHTAIELLQKLYRLTYEYDHTKMNELRQEHKRAQEQLEQIVLKIGGLDAQIAMHLSIILQYIYDCFGSTEGLRH
ncbi:MAG TPA: hypothetical protein VJK52_01040, partial [Candidatus Nanoarchaeia archaeon]|nr:hypothetical protein [Candidatus Nanoarchaeia archaeon]